MAYNKSQSLLKGALRIKCLDLKILSIYSIPLRTKEVKGLLLGDVKHKNGWVCSVLFLAIFKCVLEIV